MVVAAFQQGGSMDWTIQCRRTIGTLSIIPSIHHEGDGSYQNIGRLSIFEGLVLKSWIILCKTPLRYPNSI